MSKSNVLTTPLYSNIQVQNSAGEHIFNCSHKKVKWYLARNLAEIIQHSPLIIRLNFQVKGNGNAHDPFYLQTRENICVVCGSNQELTRHHIIPLCYRRNLPEQLKDHSSYDILPVCQPCHYKYEEHADQLKHQLREELGIPKKSQPGIDREKHKIHNAASALIKHADVIPPVKKLQLLDILNKYYGRDITDDDIREASRLSFKIVYTEKSDALQVVEKITDLEAFIIRWRKHFISHTNPQHLPKYWIVERPIKNA
jgi:hypothetical protein